MKNVHHITLASLRAMDPDGFDRAIKSAVREAAEQVGSNVVIKALCGKEDYLQLKKAA